MHAFMFSNKDYWGLFC